MQASCRTPRAVRTRTAKTTRTRLTLTMSRPLAGVALEMLSPRLDRILVTNAAFKEGHELANAMSVCGRREGQEASTGSRKEFYQIIIV